MKQIKQKYWTIAMVVVLFVLIFGFCFHLNAGEVYKDIKGTGSSESWWTQVSVSPYGAVRHPDFGKPEWGGGLDLGYQINRVVSINLANSVFDTPHLSLFDHSAIDETELVFKADLIQTGGRGRDRFVASLLGSGTRNWEYEDWAFGAGIGAELRLTKNLGLGADSRIRAFFNNDKDVITRMFVNLRF